MSPNRAHEILFGIGDYLAGGATGAATALVVRATVSPTLDMVLAMLIGMIVGMVVHVVMGAVLSPLLGFFHLMVPGSLIGMYGGMAFAMRDTMQHPPGSLSQAIWVGIIFGFAVVAMVRLYNRALLPRRSARGSAGGY